MRDIVAALGEPLSTDANGKPLVVSTSEPAMVSSSSSENLQVRRGCAFLNASSNLVLESGPIQRKRAMTTGGNTALANTINEFVVTERSYVKHLRIMKEVSAHRSTPALYLAAQIGLSD